MQLSRFSIRATPTLLFGMALLIVFAAALFIRIYFAYDNVFPDDWVRFQINDPWFQMRSVENMLHHFPDRSLFDPYGHFDRGQSVAVAPFFPFIIALMAWVFGGGSPSRELVETIGAYYPAILGALACVVMFFLGSALFNKRLGLIAAGLMAVLPGQYLLRTLLGFTDQHCAEILLSLFFMLMFVVALKSASSRGLTWQHLRSRDWFLVKRPLLLSVVAGLALGCYMISWLGASVFIFILFIFLVVQSVVDHLRGRSVDYLCFTGSVTALVALPIVAGTSSQYLGSPEHMAALAVAFVAFVGVWIMSAFLAHRGWPRWSFPVVLAGGLGIGYLLFWLVDPSLLSDVVGRFGIFAPTAAKGTISEVQAMNWDRANIYFTTGRVIAPIALIPLAWIVVSKREPEKVLLFIWTIVLLLATWKLSRFAYYSAANVAILVAYASWLLLRVAGAGRTGEEEQKVQAAASAQKGEEAKRALTRKERRAARQKARKVQRRGNVLERPVWRHVYVAIALVIIFFFGFYYNIDMSLAWAQELRGPTDDWHSALVWMRENTPPPFEDEDYYYANYETPSPGEKFQYPETAYGVMSWWDYGYHITYIAKRIPNANPSGQKGAPWAARFFTAQDEAEGSDLLDKYGSKYIVIDDLMSTGQFVRVGDQEVLTSWKFYAMAIIADRAESDFYEVVYTQQGQPVRVYYPAYYRAMVSRLYNFGAEEWDPDEAARADERHRIRAMTFRTQKDRQGNTIKIALSEEFFDSYSAAQSFVDDNPEYRLVGTDPLVSPVPLEALEQFELVYKSPTAVSKRGDATFSEVEVFEYKPQP